MHRTRSTPSRASGVVLVVAISWFVTVFISAPLHGGEFVAPSTISRQAQDALAKFSRAAATAPLPAPDDIEAWKKI